MELYDAQKRAPMGNINWLKMTFAWNKCVARAFANGAPLDIKSQRLLQQFEACFIKETRAHTTSHSQVEVQQSINPGVFRTANTYIDVQKPSPSHCRWCMHQFPVRLAASLCSRKTASHRHLSKNLQLSPSLQQQHQLSCSYCLLTHQCKQSGRKAQVGAVRMVRRCVAYVDYTNLHSHASTAEFALQR